MINFLTKFKNKLRYLVETRTPRLLAAPVTYLYIKCGGLNFKVWGGYTFGPHIEENCKLFLKPEQLADNKYMKKLQHDIVKSYLLYGTNANEYFCYDFPSKSHQERDSYLPRRRKDTMLMRLTGNQSDVFQQLRNKLIFYKLVKPFFGRDVCGLSGKEDLESLMAFCAKHPHFIAKPLDGGCGKGVEIINLEDFHNNVQEVFEHLTAAPTSYILEELIRQDSRVAQWNDSSVNTIRVPSVLTSKGQKIFYPSIRIGRKGCHVDNAGAGGTFAAIDPLKGVLISDGFDKCGHAFKEHPDSHIIYKGWQIPEWDKLLSTVKVMHELLPKGHKYVAFDMALSDKGWVVVEGNRGELSMPQIEFKKGLYKEFENLLLS